MNFMDEIGSRILHTYQVFNKGPWRVGTVDIHFEWPFQVANNKPQGKWLLYMEDIPTVECKKLLHFFKKNLFDDFALNINFDTEYFIL